MPDMKLMATAFALLTIALLACSSAPPDKKTQVIGPTTSPLKAQSACPPACDCQDFDENGRPGPVYACTCDQDFNCEPID